MLRMHINRFLLLAIVATIVAVVFNEVAFRLQAEESDRAPRRITFVIPQGTAERVRSGDPVQLFPEEMIFVVGDELQVTNQDVEPHQLGPVFVPAGTSASLLLEKAARLSYDCSFQSSRYLGLDVRPATTLGTRIIGLLLTAPTLAVLLYLYSLAARPIIAVRRLA